MTDLPAQPAEVEWPTSDWSEGATHQPLERLLGGMGANSMGVTLAVLVVQNGRLVAERYGPETTRDTPLLSWSMAKSITHALAGIVVGRGQLDVHRPAAVPEWTDPADPRRAITVDHLLRMTSGLVFVEDYVDDRISDTIAMLFGDGRHDMAAFAASLPLAHPPNTVWNYSSGTTNIICRLLDAASGGLAAVMNEGLFGPLGMRSARPGFDEAGTFVGSSYVHATARDFARFGLLYLRDGIWEGRRLLPEGWVDYARTPTPESEDLSYGAHWWLWPGRGGAFYASGYEGQYLVVVPSRDLVVVRLGKTDATLRPHVVAWLDEIIAATA
jgi:CubicO group peptidase (beta-lactamase class C family)